MKVTPIPILVPSGTLSVGCQQIIRSLRSLLQRGLRCSNGTSTIESGKDRFFSGGAGALVVSAVAGHIPDDSGIVAGAAPVEWSVGVNFALHRAFQGESCGCPGEGTLKGLLKGCAEQNALGSFAAQGRSYHDVRHVFLCSTMETRIRSRPGRQGDRRDHHVVRFPCPECWSHLCSVAGAVHRCRNASRDSITLHIIVNRPTDEEGDVVAPAVVATPPELCWDPSLYCASSARGGVLPKVQFVL